MNRLLATVALAFTIAAVPLRAQAGDGDHDGVPDALDRCPHTEQMTKLPADFRYRQAVNPERLKPGPRAYPVNPDGCEPDTDGDGVVDSRDYCPEDTAEALSKGIAANGCPRHSDRDGTPDYRDACPDTPAGTPTDARGCPKGAGS